MPLLDVEQNRSLRLERRKLLNLSHTHLKEIVSLIVASRGVIERSRRPLCWFPLPHPDRQRGPYGVSPADSPAPSQAPPAPPRAAPARRAPERRGPLLASLQNSFPSCRRRQCKESRPLSCPRGLETHPQEIRSYYRV